MKLFVAAAATILIVSSLALAMPKKSSHTEKAPAAGSAQASTSEAPVLVSECAAPSGSNIATLTAPTTTAVPAALPMITRDVFDEPALMTHALFSSTGAHVLIGGPTGAKLWDTKKTRTELEKAQQPRRTGVIQSFEGPIFKQMALSRDGHFFLGILQPYATDSTIVLIDIRTHRKHTFSNKEHKDQKNSTYTAAILSEDSQIGYVSTSSGQLLKFNNPFLVETAPNKETEELKLTPFDPLPTHAAITCLALSENQIAYGTENKNVVILDLKTQKEITNVRHDEPIKQVEFIDHETLLSRAGDKVKLFRWDTIPSTVLFDMTLPKISRSPWTLISTYPIAFTITTNAKYAIAAQLTTFKVWDIATKKLLGEFERPPSLTSHINYPGIGSIQISPDSKKLIVLSLENLTTLSNPLLAFENRSEILEIPEGFFESLSQQP